MNIKDLKIIVHENDDLPIEGIKGTSTVGWKMVCDGELYGSYIRIDKPELTVPEVVEAVNMLLPSVRETINQLAGRREKE